MNLMATRLNFLGLLSFTLGPALAGLAAAMIPVVIHLSRSRRTKKMRFSTTRFFTDQFLRSYRMSRIRELLLLLCRMALFALLGFAVAQPLLSSSRNRRFPAARIARRGSPARRFRQHELQRGWQNSRSTAPATRRKSRRIAAARRQCLPSSWPVAGPMDRARFSPDRRRGLTMFCRRSTRRSRRT